MNRNLLACKNIFLQTFRVLLKCTSVTFFFPSLPLFSSQLLLPFTVSLSFLSLIHFLITILCPLSLPLFGFTPSEPPPSLLYVLPVFLFLLSYPSLMLLPLLTAPSCHGDCIEALWEVVQSLTMCT